jgi:enoyl-CoA hydratase/carnithine racemase
MSDRSLRVEREAGVMILTLDRPQAKNAMDRALVAELMVALRDAADDDGVTVVLLTGAGSVFCPGGDIKELDALATQGGEAFIEAGRERVELFAMLRELPKLTIACVNGAAIGGGAGLAMSCDLAIAAEEAWFSYPEARRGVVPGVILVSLARLAGERMALELILSGRKVAAAEALQLGLLNRVVPLERLREEAMAYAAQFVTPHLEALRHTKALFHEVCELDYRGALERGRDINAQTRPSSGMSSVSAGVKP